MKLRFFLFVLMAALLPLTAGLVVTAQVVQRVPASFESRINGALATLEARLEGDAARRRELLLRLSDPQALVSSALRDAAAQGVAPSAELPGQLRAAITELVPGFAPEFVAVATAHGAQVSVTDRAVRELPAASAPLVQGALSGHVTEKFALFDVELYRFFAVPVGIAEGAIVIGDRLGRATAMRLRDVTRNEITFVVGDTPVVSSIPLDRDIDLNKDVVPATQRLHATLRSGRLSLGLIGFEFLDRIFPLFAPGDAMLSLAKEIDSGIFAVVSLPTAREAGWLGFVQLVCIALAFGTVLVGLVWMWLVFAPLHRQVRTLEAHFARLRAERGARLGTRGFSGPFVPLVETLDKLAEHLARDAAARPIAPAPAPREVSQPEGPRLPLRPPEVLPLASAHPASGMDHPEETPAAFPFGDDPMVRTLRTQAVDAPRSTAFELPREVVRSSLNSPLQSEGGAALAREPLDPPVSPEDHLETDRTEPLRRDVREDDEPSSDAEPYGASTAFAGETEKPEATPHAYAAVAGLAAAAAEAEAETASAGEHAQEQESEEDDGQDGVPDDLLARSRELEREFLEQENEPEEDPEEAHYREVYEEFIDTRRRCAEPADGLTLEKFAARLRKNRDQLIAKYGCRTVRFQVYVKDGKAAIKASPVK